MQLPSPKKLAQAIANTSFSIEEKKKILNSLPHLSVEKINKLYLSLLDLQAQESRAINEVERIDLKYKIRLESEIAKAKLKTN